MSTGADQRVPAVEGWFTTDPESPALLGLRCEECGTYVFPPAALACPSPDCACTELEPVELSRHGTVWSHTVNHYAPPEPYVAPDPFVPYGVAAVELAKEGVVVLGQVVPGDVGAVTTGANVELVVETLFEADGVEHVVWKWGLAGDAVGAADTEGATGAEGAAGTTAGEAG